MLKMRRNVRSNSKSSMMLSELLNVPSALRRSETPITKLAKQSNSKMLNNYKYVRKLGEGNFAKVELY